MGLGECWSVVGIFSWSLIAACSKRFTRVSSCEIVSSCTCRRWRLTPAHCSPVSDGRLIFPPLTHSIRHHKRSTSKSHYLRRTTSHIAVLHSTPCNLYCGSSVQSPRPAGPRGKVILFATEVPPSYDHTAFNSSMSRRHSTTHLSLLTSSPFCRTSDNTYLH
jgi:hypothetical protein